MTKYSLKRYSFLLFIFMIVNVMKIDAQVTATSDQITINRINSPDLDGLFLDILSPSREFKLNRAGHILLRNNQMGTITDYWHLGARDNGNLDISLGPLTANNVVSIDDALFTFTPSGDVGIGTAEPRQELDVNGDIAITGGLKRLLYYNGSTIDATVGFIGSTFWIDNNRSNSDTEISAGDDLILRTNGQDIAIFINESGRVGVNNGAANPDSDFHIVQNANNNKSTGLRLEDNDGTNWNIWTDNGDDLAFGDNDAFRAQIEDGTGSFNITSDKRLKENIRSMEGVLDRVMELKPSWYNYRSDKKKQKTLGFIAQEVEQQFPKFVKEAHGNKALTYDYFAVLSIKAIQEVNQKLETENSELRAEMKKIHAENASIKEELEYLKQLVQKSVNHQQIGSSQSITLTDAALLQNQPNPFNGSTLVRYFVPQGVKNAVLSIINTEGKMIKEIAISTRGEGQITFDTTILSNGTYQYSLILDGQVIDTKQMILTK